MGKLVILVCEKFSSEFIKTLEHEGYKDVEIKPFACLCGNEDQSKKTEKLLSETLGPDDEGLILCGRHCSIVGLSGGSLFGIKTFPYCYHKLVNENIIEYIVSKGGHIVGSDWLNNWKENIRNMGFDEEAAKLFYKDFCLELVFFDAGIDETAEEKMKEFANFVDRPYVMIPHKLETIELMLKSAVYEWRFRTLSLEYSRSFYQLKTQCAEYAETFDLVGDLACCMSKRDTIEKIKEIFMTVLGAQSFRFNNYDETISPLPKGQSYMLEKDGTKFVVQIEYGDKIFGYIEAGEFILSQHIERYLTFVVEVAKVSGLVLSNIEAYEKLMEQEQEVQYRSFHDSLTKLYNKTYVNDFMNNRDQDEDFAVFLFDIERLQYVNDTFGKEAGDELVKSAANILRRCFRENDIVARMNGEELLAILPEGDPKVAEIVRERLVETINKNNETTLEEYLKVGLSIGFAMTETDRDTIETLMQRAEAYMQENNGNNPYRIH